MDVQMLTLLHSLLPDIQITTDIVEGSTELSDDFKGKFPPLRLCWHKETSSECSLMKNKNSFFQKKTQKTKCAAGRSYSSLFFLKAISHILYIAFILVLLSFACRVELCELTYPMILNYLIYIQLSLERKTELLCCTSQTAGN